MIHDTSKQASASAQPINAVYDPRQWSRYIPATFERISPLYAHLARQMEHDPELLALLALVDTDQPLHVLFFSVVQFLLLQEPTHPLAAFYPLMRQEGTRTLPLDLAYPFFRSFCLERQEELRYLLSTARLQTNEVTRCANLLPAFERVSRWEGRRPLALIEIGTSAGLNLHWDAYRYHYVRQGPAQSIDTHVAVGDPSSPVRIQCLFEGEHFPPVPRVMPPVARRIGIDVVPRDVTNEDDVRWLRACIWPEEIHRHQLLQQALTFARQRTMEIITGDACDVLPDLIASLPVDVTVCVFHSYALEQGPPPIKERILTFLQATSRAYDIYRISLEMKPSQWTSPRLELFHYAKGMLARYEHLADCEVHGEQMRWLAG